MRNLKVLLAEAGYLAESLLYTQWMSITKTWWLIMSIVGNALILLIISYLALGWGSHTKPISLSGSQTPKHMSYHSNIVSDTQENENFRKVLFTGSKSQLVVMSIPPGGEVGKETHEYTEQTLFFLSGIGEGEFDGKKFPVGPGDVVVVVPGTEHNFWNTGTESMKIYTVYSPPNHIDGRVHATKAIADADTADEAIGEVAPVCTP
jgi:mannose-6-phosphate isomerase-like protein (cupin superfamily)